MNTKSLLIDPLRLQYLIEGRKDDKGHDYFIVTFSNIRLKFNSIDSVLDLVGCNSVGYVGK